jgi:hypothetical protein
MKKQPLSEAEKVKRQRDNQARWRKLNPNYHKLWHAAHKNYVTKQKRIYRALKKLED